ncbi:hypothetical protein HZS_1442 [Henneguya salminicola]|nr:hypothetical protein HZS_1442 [Henneguya salminicola]
MMKLTREQAQSKTSRICEKSAENEINPCKYNRLTMPEKLIFDGFEFHMNKRTGTTAVATGKCIHACGVAHQPVAEDASQYIKEFIRAQALNRSKYPDDNYHLILPEVNGKFQLRVIKIPTKRKVYSIIRYARGLFAPVEKFEGMIKAPFAQTQDGRAAGAVCCYYGVWCSTTGKNEHIYCEILHNIFILLNYDWMPRMCYRFRNGIIKGVEYQFTETTIIGCNFNLRQAFLRKMQKYGIPAAERNSCMQFIGVLSVIPIDEL